MRQEHYVRRYNKWVPESGATYVRQANPIWRWLAAAAIVAALSALIIVASMYLGAGMADSYGPLITVTPSPTPYPDGWTP
jgi:hypothetical protein